MHRIIAAKTLVWKTIRAEITQLVEEIDLEIAEIDENIMRYPLSCYQLDRALKRRKVLYEIKYPQTKKGAAQGEVNRKAVAEKRGAAEQNGKQEREAGFRPHGPESKPAAFITDTANKTGKSLTVLKDAIRRGGTPDTEKLEGTPLDDNAKALDALAVMNEQAQKLKEESARKEAEAEEAAAHAKKAAAEGRNLIAQRKANAASWKAVHSSGGVSLSPWR